MPQNTQTDHEQCTSHSENRGTGPDIPQEWLAEFEAAARRSLETRFRYAFIKTYKPVMDDVPFRAFDTTADYRKWCVQNLPCWLGYGPPGEAIQ